MNTRCNTLGSSLLELMVSTGILAISIVTVVSVLISSMHLDNQTHEMSTADQAAQFKIEQLRGMTFATLVSMVTTDTDGDGDNNTYREDFAVLGLSPTPDDADGMCGWAEVSRLDETGSPLDPSGNNNLLRLHVIVQWRSRSGGAQQVELFGLRSDRGENWTSGN